jgi:hypothetical protein
MFPWKRDQGEIVVMQEAYLICDLEKCFTFEKIPW